MKKVFYLIAFVVVAASCRQKKHGAFVVSGVIENAPGRKLTLMETPYASAQPVILDSTFLTSKGSFTLKGRANEEGIFRLVIENGPDVILINDNNELTLRLDVNDYRNYKVEGSPASESLHHLFENYRYKDSIILSTFKKIDSIRATPGQDSVVEVYQTRNDLEIAGLNSLLKEFIQSSGSPAAAFYALGMASQTIPTEELKTIVDASAKKFPEHAGLARVKSLLAVKKADPPKATDQAAAENTYALLNKQAPNLVMNDVNGKPVSINSFKGKYVLVDFWASWCMPCRMENPNVVAAYNQFKGKNFTILGVSLDEDKAAWKKAIANDKLTWTHMSDLKQWESAAVAAYGIEGIPFNVLLDPSGKIIGSSLTGERLVSTLSQALK
ncbi:MAG TPA: TlpA disulfide reductase family protein [Segetibacter sp.]